MTKLSTSANVPFNPNTIRVGDPVWMLALFYPPQGSWTEEDYFRLEAAGRLVEFDQGCVEVLEMPTIEHQRIVRFLVQLIQSQISAEVGEILFAPLPVRLWASKFREPDIIFLRRGRSQYRGYPDGADLVIEVVSDDPQSRRRDVIEKTADYAKAGIEEYWIVDPTEATVTVNRLVGGIYQATCHRRREQVKSASVDGLEASVDDILDSAERPA